MKITHFSGETYRASLIKNTAVSWSLTEFCEAENQLTVLLYTIRLWNDYKLHSRRHQELPEDTDKL